MRSFLRVHQGGELILVNPCQIQTVCKCGSGSAIYFAGEEDALELDEEVEDIDRKIMMS